MKNFTNGGIHYQDLGDPQKLPIILLHGMTFNLTMWNPQIQVLKKNYRVIAYDMRGHGLSDIGDGQYTYKMFANDLIDLMDHLGIEKAVLCGLSMGGALAIRTYEMYPDRIIALILSDTRSEADSNDTKEWRENSIELIKNNGLKRFTNDFLEGIFARDSFKSHPEAVKLIRNIVLSTSPRSICGVLLAQAARTDMTHVLPKIKVPTLIMIGENDNFTPLSSSKIMNEKIADSKLKIIPKAGHISNLENTPEFNRNLIEFLNNINP
jgi:3-oxoadipate enol-lactonase